MPSRFLPQVCGCFPKGWTATNKAGKNRKASPGGTHAECGGKFAAAHAAAVCCGNALAAAGLLADRRRRPGELLAVNPYELRRSGLREKLELHEIGRLLLHLNQRRGFLSNRKTDKATDRRRRRVFWPR